MELKLYVGFAASLLTVAGFAAEIQVVDWEFDSSDFTITRPSGVFGDEQVTSNEYWACYYNSARMSSINGNATTPGNILFDISFRFKLKWIPSGPGDDPTPAFAYSVLADVFSNYRSASGVKDRLDPGEYAYANGVVQTSLDLVSSSAAISYGDPPGSDFQENPSASGWLFEAGNLQIASVIFALDGNGDWTGWTVWTAMGGLMSNDFYGEMSGPYAFIHDGQYQIDFILQSVAGIHEFVDTYDVPSIAPCPWGGCELGGTETTGGTGGTGGLDGGFEGPSAANVATPGTSSKLMLAFGLLALVGAAFGFGRSIKNQT